MDFYTVSITLFLVMDPMGNIPVFLSVLEKVPEKRRRMVLIRELFFALVLIILFLFFGRYGLALLDLRQESISIAGGIILFLIALRMVFPTRETEPSTGRDAEPFLVPLAIPMVAGPSTLAILLLFSTEQPDRLLELLGAAAVAWTGTFIVLFSSTFLLKVLGRRGLTAIERLMGMILVAMAVQLFLDGLAKTMN